MDVAGKRAAVLAAERCQGRGQAAGARDVDGSRGGAVDVEREAVARHRDEGEVRPAPRGHHGGRAEGENRARAGRGLLDGGGCLPVFDADGRVVQMGVGHAGSLLETVRELVARRYGLDRILPAFTSNVAALLRLSTKGALRVGADADLVVLDAEYRVRDVMARGSWHIQGGMTVRRGTFEPA